MLTCFDFLSSSLIHPNLMTPYFLENKISHFINNWPLTQLIIVMEQLWFTVEVRNLLPFFIFIFLLMIKSFQQAISYVNNNEVVRGCISFPTSFVGKSDWMLNKHLWNWPKWPLPAWNLKHVGWETTKSWWLTYTAVNRGGHSEQQPLFSNKLVTQIKELMDVT